MNAVDVDGNWALLLKPHRMNERAVGLVVSAIEYRPWDCGSNYYWREMRTTEQTDHKEKKPIQYPRFCAFRGWSTSSLVTETVRTTEHTDHTEKKPIQYPRFRVFCAFRG